MNKNVVCFIIFLFISLLVHPSSRPVFAATSDELRRAGLDEVIIREILTQVELNREIKKIDQDIKNKKSEIEEAREQSKAYEQAIAQKQKEAATLKNQLSLLDSKIAKAKLDISLTKKELEETAFEINSFTLKIQEKEQEIASNKEAIAQVLFNSYKESKRGPLEVLLLYNIFSDFFNVLTYLEGISKDLNNLIKHYELTKDSLALERASLQIKKQELESLDKTLGQQKITFEEHQRLKGLLLTRTKASEVMFQKLLADLRAEQNAIEAEIKSLEERFRAKLKAKGELNNEAVAFDWLVPNSGISAYFHDPTYLFRKVFEHPAIDIRTLKSGKSSNGLPVRAAERGYVVQAKNSGMGYSYVLLMHNKGFSTVYGHVSKILVSEGEYVSKGQVVALSGGMPGTPGAGRLTTGPHLHFEVRLNGVPVDPLPYLP